MKPCKQEGNEFHFPNYTQILTRPILFQIKKSDFILLTLRFDDYLQFLLAY